jgi:hypothetical protein
MAIEFFFDRHFTYLHCLMAIELFFLFPRKGGGVCHMVLKSLHQGLSKNIDAPFCCHPMVGVCQFVGHPFVPLNHAFNL